jgi:RNA polymerase sigma-70 factor (ECF subfamily)
MPAFDDTRGAEAGRRPLGPAIAEPRASEPPAASPDSEPPPELPRPTFREVYDEHFAFVWRSVAYCGIAADARDDVVQEVFIVVHRKLPEFERRSSLRTWIAAVVRRVVADYVRKRRNQPAADELLEREPAGGSRPSDQLERKAAAALLQTLLGKMSEEQREIFLLHELEHLSGIEIAALTATNENTVWTRLRAARRIFQEGVARERARQTREQR